MSDEKRRNARIQGGWAQSDGGQKRNDGSQNVTTVDEQHTDRLKAEQQKGQFTYVDSGEALPPEIPKEKVVSVEGVHDISSGPSGLSRLYFYPNFIEIKEADLMFERLHRELPWEQRVDKAVDNVLREQPRLTAWFGDLPYTYSKLTHEPNSNWHPTLVALKERMQALTGYTFNSMLANLYRDGKDNVDWHSDDEPSLRKNPTIASLSFGDTRNFELRKKPSAGGKDDYTYSERLKVPLTHGSLLIMEGSTQDDWQHRIPKEYHDKKPRINLTFRTIYPE